MSSSGPERRRGRSWTQRLVLLTNVVLIGTSLTAAALLQYGYDRASDIQRVELGRTLTPVPDGSATGGRVLNILLVGSDSSAGLDPSNPVQIGRQGERFGDVIILAHIDEPSGQLALLSFPRDLWLPLAGVNRSDRINRAFEVGGPAMLIDTIEQNFDLPIHHYVNIDFAGFQGLVEAVGSVDVYFETPARDWNVGAKPEPRSQTGFIVDEAGCHALDPPTALAYVRSRYYQTQTPDGDWVTDPTSDFGRISRQQDFLKRLMYRAIDLGARNPFVLTDMIDTGLENVAIDESLTPQLLVDLGRAYRTFDPGTLQTYSFPVVDSEIDGNQVLEPVAAEAEPLLAFMRGAPHDDPATIDLSIVSSGDLIAGTSSTVSDLVDELQSAGFELHQQAAPQSPAGITVNHGPNGIAAARVVVRAVSDILGGLAPTTGSAPQVQTQQVDGLRGRSVQLVVGTTVGGQSPSNGSATSSAISNLPHTESSATAPDGTPTPAEAAPTAGFEPQSSTTNDLAATDGEMANGSPSSTLGDGNRDGHYSRGQTVDSEETACRST